MLLSPLRRKENPKTAALISPFALFASSREKKTAFSAVWNCKIKRGLLSTKQVPKRIANPIYL
jgi:hypothetical protein